MQSIRLSFIFWQLFSHLSNTKSALVISLLNVCKSVKFTFEQPLKFERRMSTILFATVLGENCETQQGSLLFAAYSKCPNLRTAVSALDSEKHKDGEVETIACRGKTTDILIQTCHQIHSGKYEISKPGCKSKHFKTHTKVILLDFGISHFDKKCFSILSFGWPYPHPLPHPPKNEY